jgi:chemotaxis protein methyltransferase CheR
MPEYTKNYQDAGGRDYFFSYYTVKYDNAILSPELKNNIVFAQHNLATDEPFNQFNLILCRNVIYFNNTLQQRYFTLFHGSLCIFGFLGLCGT